VYSGVTMSWDIETPEAQKLEKIDEEEDEDESE
jgi:hypothetical protein